MTKFETFIERLWLSCMSLMLWFTLLSTPAIMLFSEINQQLQAFLWINEVFWTIDIVRKLFFRYVPNEDRYTTTTNYLKSTFMLDLIANLPQILSMMNPTITFLKNLRLYQISLLHYPVNLLIGAIPGIESQHLVSALTHGAEVLF